jgi:hypothetical protein
VRECSDTTGSQHDPAHPRERSHLGTYLNWAVTLAAAAWGAGGTTMPLAAGGHLGTPNQELTLLVDLRPLNVAMFASCFLVLWGLRGEGPPRSGSRSPC